MVWSTFTAVGQCLYNTGRGTALAVGERTEEMSLCANGFFQQLATNRLLTLILTPDNEKLGRYLFVDWSYHELFNWMLPEKRKRLNRRSWTIGRAQNRGRMLAISSGAGQQIFASRYNDSVAADVLYGVIGLAMPYNVRLQPNGNVINWILGNLINNSNRTSKTSWEAAKSRIEFCIADKMPRLTLRDQTGSSTDGQICSICPSWKEKTSDCCWSPSANWDDPGVIDLADPSCGSDCSRVTLLSWEIVVNN